MKHSDRVLEVMTQIMIRLSSAEDPADEGEKIFDELADNGYSHKEISGAVAMINRALENLTNDSLNQLPDTPLKRHRPITKEERLRMSDEAIDIFRLWTEKSVISPQEAEDVLRDIILSGPGDIEKADLLRIAHTAARQGSTLQLFLSESASKH